MDKNINFKSNFLAIFAFILTFSLQLNASEHRFDLSNLPEIQTGDLIFRATHEFDSQIIIKISDFKYSHIGFIVNAEPILIVHATTNDDKNRKNQVILSTLDEFVKDATKFGISRINFLTQSEKNNIAQTLLARIGEPFVLLKDSQDSLYCTTLLEHAIAKFTPFSPVYQQVDTAVFKGKYLFPKAFFEYSGIKAIYENGG